MEPGEGQDPSLVCMRAVPTDKRSILQVQQLDLPHTLPMTLHKKSANMQDEQEAVGHLIKYLQAMQGRPLWSFEESNLQRPHLGSAAALQFFVQSLVCNNVFCFPLLLECASPL